MSVSALRGLFGSCGQVYQGPLFDIAYKKGRYREFDLRFKSCPMFSLIISGISVFLVAILALATVYYGSDAYFQSGYKATAAQLTNEAEQLRLAIQMYETDHGKLPETLADLTVDETYLRKVPDSWGNSSQYFTKSTYDVNQDVCLQFNIAHGVPFVPECTDEVYRNAVVCCRNTLMSE